MASVDEWVKMSYNHKKKGEMEMLEKMAAFFEARLDGYDQHMLSNIAGAEEFYPVTAALLPLQPGASVLDLGCGTGLELEYYFAQNPGANVTGIDLSAGMLQALKVLPTTASTHSANICQKKPAQELNRAIFPLPQQEPTR